MSALSFMTSLPAASQKASTEPGKTTANAVRDRREAQAPPPPPPPTPSKIQVKTEQLTKFSFAYTFIDAETQRVVGQWPIAPGPSGYGK
jgi:hypothetical protein